MYRLGFIVFWIGLSLAIAAAAWEGPGSEGIAAWEKAALLAFPAFGLLCLRLEWPRYRRRRSLRHEMRGGVELFVWTEIDGSEHVSPNDPTPDWDAGDGDGDGD